MWMNKWMIGWMKDRMEGSDWMKELMNKRINELMKVWMNGIKWMSE